MGRAILAAMILAGAAPPTARAQETPPLREERVILENGLTVLLCPVKEASRVAVESFVRVGFADEPAGMIQATHLLEHVLCMGGTNNFEPGRSFQDLNLRGMANAETLATFTHYDYAGSSDRLEDFLRIEGDRMAGPKFTRQILLQEAPRCYEEVTAVEGNPQAGMFKHAFMALNQAWRHGAKEALLRKGLEEFAPQELERFFRATHHPSNRLLVILGGFRRDDALRWAGRHLGGAWPVPAASTPPLDWSRVPAESTVRWDSKVRAVCVGFPPPEDPGERLALAAWGNRLHQDLTTDPRVRGAFGASFTTNSTLPPGRVPFFAYATVRPGDDAAKVAQAIIGTIDRKLAAGLDEVEVAQMRAVAGQQALAPALDWTALMLQGQALGRQLAVNPVKGVDFALGNHAIQAGMRHLEGDPAARSAALKAWTKDGIERLLQKTLDPSRRFVTHILPRD